MLRDNKDTGHIHQEDLEPQQNLRESGMNQKTAKKYLVLVGSEIVGLTSFESTNIKLLSENF